MEQEHPLNLPSAIEHGTVSYHDQSTNRPSTVRQPKAYLNPVHITNRICNDPEGCNNPNIPGRDTGLNAWIDGNINRNTFNEDEQTQIMYAKRNSDNSRFFDIDDVPSRGPITLASRKDIERTAHRLINDHSNSICRSTGIQLRGELSEDDVAPPNVRAKRLQGTVKSRVVIPNTERVRKALVSPN